MSSSLQGAVTEGTKGTNVNLFPKLIDSSEKTRHLYDSSSDNSPFGRELYHFQFKRIYDRVPANVQDYLPQDDFRNLIRNCWYRCRFN